MSDTSNHVEPPRDIIAPRHESLTKAFDGDLGPRPLDYGEARLWLVARDPRWLFAYWQFVPAEHPEAITENGHPRFHLRILTSDGEVETETDIQPENGNIYLPANTPDAAYSAELGFYTKSHIWCFIAKSGTTHTPPLHAAQPAPIEITRIPASAPLPQSDNQPLIKWTVAQERTFARLLAEDVAANGKPEGRAARARAKLLALKKPIPAALTAPLDPAETHSSWSTADLPFHLNAELIFYGGTAHDATLTIAGQPTKLRHDGTFRVHTRLPDGEFEIPIIARSADGTRERKATLRFSRETTVATTATPQPDYLPASPPSQKHT